MALKTQTGQAAAKKRNFHQELVLNRWVLGFFQGGTLAALKMRLGDDRFEGIDEDGAYLVMDLVEGKPFPGREAPIPWEFIARAAPRHSILLWLGDFPPRPAPDGWAVIRRRYQPMCFRVDDPWDRAPRPTAGP
jgi:hypothetical protein